MCRGPLSAPLAAVPLAAAAPLAAPLSRPAQQSNLYQIPVNTTPQYTTVKINQKSGKYHKIPVKFQHCSVGDEARLELTDGPVGLALDCKDKVAVHDIGAGGHGDERHKVPRLERDEAGELFGNSLSLLLGLRTRHCLAVALRNRRAP